MHPLEGLRVIERGDTIPVAWCARQFAMWGADVVVDGPTDRLRAEPPFAGDGRSLLWEYVSANKRTAARCDVATADVLVTERPPAEVPGHLVVVSITPFGLDGPYADLAATDLVVQALSGYLACNGEADREPLKAPGNILAYAPGVSAFVGALAALRERERSGTGQLVEVSCQEAIASFVPTLRPQYTRRPTQREGGPGTGVRILRCADGWISLNAKPAWRALVDALLVCGVDVPLDLERPHGLYEARDAMAPYVAQANARELEVALRTVDERQALFPAVVAVADLPGHEQLAARGFWLAPGFAGPAARLSGAEPKRPEPIAPAAAWSDARVSPRWPASTDPPLAGVRVVDLTQAWIGPYASLLLADLGADVVKVESHTRPDVWRAWARSKSPSTARPGAHPGNTNVNFNSVNRNKRCLCLDLKTDQGRRLLLELVARADVVMENYTSLTLDDLRLGFDALKAVKPDIVLSSFSGYGGTGPLAGLQANGLSIEAAGGWVDMFGYPDGPPMHMAFYQADALTGLHMAALTLVALRNRDRTGEPQRVDGSMLEAAVGYVGEHVLHGAPGRVGNAPGALRRAGGGWLATTADAPETTGDAREQMHALQRKGVPAGAVLWPEDLLEDSHLASRGWFHEMTHADMGTHRYAGFPWRFSRSRLEARNPSPRLGEHSADVLREELGLDEDAIHALYEQGVTASVLDADDEMRAGGSDVVGVSSELRA